MPIQQALHQVLGVAPPIAYFPPHLRQQQHSIQQQTLKQRAFNLRLKKHQTSHWATWNLRSGRNSGLQQALLNLKDLHIAFAILTSTGFTRNASDPYSECVIHSKHFKDYDIYGTDANSSNQGGIAVAIHSPRDAGKLPPYHLENIQRHGHNCISCLCYTGIQKIPIIGAYLLHGPQGLDDLYNHVQAAFDQYPSNRCSPVFMGDFNVDLETRDLDRQQQLLDFLAAIGDLQSVVPHFKQRQRFQKMGHTTWAQPMEDGTTRRSKCDYICCRDRRLFTNVAIREPETYTKTNHYLVKATFLNATPRAHKKCLLGRNKILL